MMMLKKFEGGLMEVALENIEKELLGYYLRGVGDSTKRVTYFGVYILDDNEVEIKGEGLEVLIDKDGAVIPTSKGPAHSPLGGDGYLIGENGYYKIKDGKVEERGDPGKPKVLIKRMLPRGIGSGILVVPLEVEGSGLEAEQKPIKLIYKNKEYQIP